MPFLPLLDLGPNFSASRIEEEASRTTIGVQEHRHRNSEPIRTRASPRPTPVPTSPTSTRHHVEFDLSINETETIYLSSGEQSPIRGRTLRRMPARDRCRSRAPSIGSLASRSTGLDAGALRDKLMSRDLSATPDQYYEDAMLEPRPLERFRSYSLSEELHRAATMDDTVDLTTFTGHRDTFALLGLRRLHGNAIYLPESFFNDFVPYIDFETYKSLRLSCRYWSQAITRARPLYLRAVNRLPAEILERIYQSLEPVDFDAARRTCRSWMISSLEENLLATMLHDGGWWNATHLDMHRLESGAGRRLSAISGNWLLSKRLATECALAFGSLNPSIVQDELNACPLSLTSEIDFTELALTKSRIELRDPPLRFDVSVCQKYLLITKAHTIYVYSLLDPNNNPSHEYGGYIKPLKVIQCPQRVLAVSMDTSSDRLSVAALHGERLGMVFEMQGGDPKLSTMSSTPPSGPPNGVTELVAYNTDGSYGAHTFSQYPEAMKAANGARSTYRNICSAQDPPRSVAICPQRRCVAFGNATGIEVHWIDALSGQDLQRWFPLSSPSDYLYFLPNRIGIDSARKLRIMASAAHPVQAQIASRQYPSRTERLNKKGPWDDFTDEDQAWKLNWAFSRMSSTRRNQSAPEHYTARPLSDGHSVLFIDPVSNKLFLGGDEKIDQGVPQLTKRFALEGPVAGMIPYVYTAGTDLRWGVRVLAGYAKEFDLQAPNQLWLFNVPPDHFLAKSSQSNSDQDSIFSEDTVMTIRGIHLADVPSLSEIAVDATDGDLTLRAFSPEAGGKALTYQLAVDKNIIRKAVLEDGVTIPVITRSGFIEDVVMEDADGIVHWRMDRDLDGAASPPSPAATIRPTSRTTVHPFDRGNTEVDADGDSIMLDAPLEPACPEPSPPQPPQPDPRPDSPAPPAPLFFADTHIGGNRASEHEHEDEGYASADEGDRDTEFLAAGGAFAIHAPPLHGDWSGSDDWMPQYLDEHGEGIEDEGVGVDVLEGTRLEMVVVEL